MKAVCCVLLSVLILAACSTSRHVEVARHVETIELSGRIKSRCGECECVILTNPSRALDIGYYDIDVDAPSELVGQQVRLRFVTDWSVFEKIPVGARIAVRVDPKELEPNKFGHREASIEIDEVVRLQD